MMLHLHLDHSKILCLELADRCPLYCVSIVHVIQKKTGHAYRCSFVLKEEMYYKLGTRLYFLLILHGHFSHIWITYNIVYLCDI